MADNHGHQVKKLKLGSSRIIRVGFLVCSSRWPELATMLLLPNVLHFWHGRIRTLSQGRELQRTLLPQISAKVTIPIVSIVVPFFWLTKISIIGS